MGWRWSFSGRSSGPEWLVVGLGNPGPEYRDTRHNVGFMVAEELARRAGLAGAKRKRRYHGRLLETEAFYLLWPQTFMNQSGRSVRAALSGLNISPKQLVVVHDDLDLSLGRVKVKRGGGSAGHKGVASVIEALANRDFCRVRCGIGRPEAGQDVVDFVLSPFAVSEWSAVHEMVETAADAVVRLVTAGVEAAMNEFNRS